MEDTTIDYIFSSNINDKEFHRLQLLEECVDDFSKLNLLEAGIKHSSNCLEIGAGAGSILKWMANVLDENSQITAVDKNTRYINSFGRSNVIVLEDNIQNLEFYQSFDLIHARYVLIHNPNALELMVKLVGMLKPNGRLVIEEADFTSAYWVDKHYKNGGNRVNKAICTMFSNMGLNPAYGFDVMADMQNAGLEIVRTSSDMHLSRGRSKMANMMKASVEALEEKYIATGVCNKKDIACYLKGTQDPDSLQVYYTTTAVVGLKH